MGLKMILRKRTLALSIHTYTHTYMNMNAVVALAQAEFWPSWVKVGARLTETSNKSLGRKGLLIESP